MSKGCEWQNKSFKVYMGGAGINESPLIRCLRCKRFKGRKHKVCKFEDRGYYLSDRKRT